MPVKERPWEDDFRRMEARFEARFQAVNSRFMGVDGRFDSMEARLDKRIDELRHDHLTVAERMDQRFQQVDLRLDSTNDRIDGLTTEVGGLSSKIDRLGTIVLFNSAVCAGSLALGGVAIVI